MSCTPIRSINMPCMSTYPVIQHAPNVSMHCTSKCPAHHYALHESMLYFSARQHTVHSRIRSNQPVSLITSFMRGKNKKNSHWRPPQFKSSLRTNQLTRFCTRPLPLRPTCSPSPSPPPPPPGLLPNILPKPAAEQCRATTFNGVSKCKVRNRSSKVSFGCQRALRVHVVRNQDIVSSMSQVVIGSCSLKRLSSSPLKLCFLCLNFFT